MPKVSLNETREISGVMVLLSYKAPRRRWQTRIEVCRIKGERGLLVRYVTRNTCDRDEVSVVEDAEAMLQSAVRDGRLKLPPGYYWEWSGQFENQVYATKRMIILIPVCLFIIFVMLYLGFEPWWIAAMIYFGILVSASGGFIILGLWGVNLSIAVWVGFLVLFGVVDDDGVVISTYLEQVFVNATFKSVQDVSKAVVQAGLKRIRPLPLAASTRLRMMETGVRCGNNG